MTFSIIVPVYNVEKYLKKCLDSIINQTNQNFELLIINDGTTDNSQVIINEYADKYPSKIKSFIKQNGGLSDARNYGVERAKGEYILFIDSDDYIDKNLLQKIDETIKNNKVDVIGYNLVSVNEKDEKIGMLEKPVKMNITGEEGIIELVNNKKCFEPACGYAYRLEYWNKNNFQFMKGILHEDFALIPLVILKANKVCLLNFDGYYYVSTENSITRNNSSEKKCKSAYDLLKGYDYLTEELKNVNITNKYAKKIFLSYIANSLIYKLEHIERSLRKFYRKELRKRDISKHIMNDTIKRKIRKTIIKIKNRI